MSRAFALRALCAPGGDVQRGGRKHGTYSGEIQIHSQRGTYTRMTVWMTRYRSVAIGRRQRNESHASVRMAMQPAAYTPQRLRSTGRAASSLGMKWR